MKDTILNAGPGVGTAALDIGKSIIFSTFNLGIINLDYL